MGVDTKKKSLTQLRDEAVKEVKEVEDRRNRMTKLLEQVASLLEGDDFVFWLDEARWDAFSELRASFDGDGWDEDVHPFVEQKFPEWKTMLGCLQNREEEGTIIGTHPSITFKDAVVMFDASSEKTCDMVIRVKAGIFEVAVYWDDGWKVEGRCKTAKDLKSMLKGAGMRVKK